jgi:N-acetylglucosamine kinase-like BadF-type ATPase
MENTVTHLGADVGRTSAKLMAQTSENRTLKKSIPSREVNWGSESDILNAVREWEAELHTPLSETARIGISGTGALAFERQFTHQSRVIHLVSDLTASALSCHIRNTGLVLIAGTGGSSLILKRGEKEVRKSYGPVIGDLWGGLYLGRMAGRHLLDTWTAGERLSSYERALADHLKVQNRSEFLLLLQNDPDVFKKLASLGRITIEFTEKGHLKAEAILKSMLDHIFSEVQYAYDDIKPAGDLPVGLQGSILIESGWIQDALQTRLKRADIPADIRLAERPLELVMLQTAMNMNAK